MLKKTIVFEDYNGKEVTEDFYFNLNKAELVELQLSSKKGFAETLQEIIDAEDGQKIIDHFKQIILLAVGHRSEDGRRFIKNDEIRDDFLQCEAYSELFVELATDATSAAAFINGIVPAALAEEAQVEADKITKPTENVELPTAPPVLENSEKAPEKLSDAELLKIDPINMTRAQLQRAMQLKNTQ